MDIAQIMQGETLPNEESVGISNDTLWVLPVVDSDAIDSGQPPTYRFNGDFIGLGSTFRPTHYRHPHTMFMESGSGYRCNRCRWFELRIFYDNDQTGYLLHFAGRSMVPGEIQRYRIERALTAYELIEIMSGKAAHGQQSRNDPDFVPHLTAPGRRALSQAAGFDDDIKDAYTDRMGKL